jgi:DNA-binding transcriptional LysR family regulator
VVLTEAGALLRARCVDILASIGEAVELVGGFASAGAVAGVVGI